MSRYCKHGIDPRNCSECPSQRTALEPSATTPCSPSSIPGAAWHDEYLKASDRAIRMERERDRLRVALEAIEERYTDGCDTYEDWKFMGDTARAILSENAREHPFARDGGNDATPTL